MSLSKENDKKSLFSKYEEASKQKRNEDKKQNFMKINKINPEILTTINNIKESSNCYLSSVDNLINTMKRNILIKNIKAEKNEGFGHLNDTVFNNPYLSDNLKNKYSALLTETFCSFDSFALFSLSHFDLNSQKTAKLFVVSF